MTLIPAATSGSFVTLDKLFNLLNLQALKSGSKERTQSHVRAPGTGTGMEEELRLVSFLPSFLPPGRLELGGS